MQITIRKATESDIKTISEIYELVIKADENAESVTGWQLGIYPTEDTAAKALRRGDLFVEEADGQIVGTAIINQTQVDVYKDANWQYEASDDEVMVLHTLSIDPRAKGRGLGRAFVKFYEEYALKNGCKFLRIDTNAKNLSARKFYEKLNYSERNVKPCTFNGIQGVNLVLLEKKL